MTKHYSQKDNLISIMKEISKKTPRGIVNGDTQVGHITWQMYLMRDYLKLDGTPLANASNDYSDLLSFAQDNNLITADTTDNSLFKYDSTTDVLTLPNYIDLVLQGGNSVEEKEAGLPNIKGSFDFGENSGIVTQTNLGSISGTTRGAIRILAGSYAGAGTTLTGWAVYDFDASRSNPIYSDSVNTVQPPAITLIPQIKYRKATTMYEQIDAVVNYSTTEKVVGTWIDGKPLYQKTYSCTSPSTAEIDTDMITLDNIINVINIDGYLVTGNAASVPINFYYSSTIYISTWQSSNNLNVMMRVSTSYTNQPVYITLQYTKTTD